MHAGEVGAVGQGSEVCTDQPCCCWAVCPWGRDGLLLLLLCFPSSSATCDGRWAAKGVQRGHDEHIGAAVLWHTLPGRAGCRGRGHGAAAELSLPSFGGTHLQRLLEGTSVRPEGSQCSWLWDREMLRVVPGAGVPQ